MLFKMYSLNYLFIKAQHSKMLFKMYSLNYLFIKVPSYDSPVIAALDLFVLQEQHLRSGIIIWIVPYQPNTYFSESILSFGRGGFQNQISHCGWQETETHNLGHRYVFW